MRVTSSLSVVWSCCCSVFKELQNESMDALRAAEAYRNIVKAIDEAYNASVDAKASGQTALNIVRISLFIV